jgi:hypothetical protein
MRRKIGRWKIQSDLTRVPIRSIHLSALRIAAATSFSGNRNDAHVSVLAINVLSNTYTGRVAFCFLSNWQNSDARTNQHELLNAAAALS